MKTDEPFGLPAGTVRGIITLALIGVCVAMLFVHTVSGVDDIKNMIVLLTGIAIRDYFQVRQDQQRTEAANPTPGPIAN